MATSVKLDDDLNSRVKQLATRRQRTPHWLMREAIKQYVEREEARDSFGQEAASAWAAYRKTGLHLTGEEVRIWLDTWGTEGETEPPACHD
jgi:predicted transcriptional regulator